MEHKKILRACANCYPEPSCLATRTLSDDFDATLRIEYSIFRSSPSEYNNADLASLQKRITQAVNINSVPIPEDLSSIRLDDNVVLEHIEKEIAEKLPLAFAKRGEGDSHAVAGYIDAIRAHWFKGVQKAMNSSEDEKTKRFLLWCAIAFHRKNDLQKKSREELMALFEANETPSIPSNAPVVFIMSGIPGIGKSTLAKILAKTLAIPYVCQDDEDGKRERFLKRMMTLLDEQRKNRRPVVAVIADRNNHTCSHRQKVIDTILSGSFPMVRIVSVSMKIPEETEEIVAFCQWRIRQRGTNHPKLTTQVPDWEGIPERFAQEYEPVVFRGPDNEATSWDVPILPGGANDNLDFLFDAHIEVDPSLNPIEKAEYVLSQLDGILPPSVLSSLNLQAAASAVMQAEFGPSGQPPADSFDEDGSSPSTPRSSARAAAVASPSPSANRFSPLPDSPKRAKSSAKSPSTSPSWSPHQTPERSNGKYLYYAIKFTADQGHALGNLVTQLDGATPLDRYPDQRPLQEGPHVTLLFLGSGSSRASIAEEQRDLIAEINARMGESVTIQVTQIVQNKKATTAVVAIPEELRKREPDHVPHITMALNGEKAVYSNTLLRSAFVQRDGQEQGHVFALSSPFSLTGTISGMR